MFINDKNNDGLLSPPTSLGMFTEKTNKHLAGRKARILFHPNRQTLAEQSPGPATTLNTLSDGTTNSLVFGRGNGKQG